MKRKVAIWIHGGIGNGDFSQGYPMLSKIFYLLSEEFDIVVYSHMPPNEGFLVDKFVLKYPPRTVKSEKVRWLFLIYYFLRDHIQKRFDVTFAFWGYPIGFIVALIKVLLKVPCIIYVLGADSTSIPSINYGIFHRRFPRIISTWAYRKADELLTTAEFLKAKLRNFSIDRDIKVIPWGADPAMFTFSQKQKGEILNVIHVANIHPVKDQVTLLRAFERILKRKPARLKIFGLDCMDGAMHKLCIELGIQEHVDFEGVIRYEHLPKYYETAHLMLHTALSEAQCMALTEAAATGVLIAGTRVGLLYEIGEDSGIAVQVRDFEDLAEKVLDLLDKPDEWNRRVKNAKAWSDDHSLDWTINKLTDLLLMFPKN